MARIGSGKNENPFYRNVDGTVIGELNKRAAFYGSRVRSERVVPGTKGFPEAERLLWSYGKVAYAIIRGDNGVTLGTSYSKVMSDSGGNLTLYDSTRNQPKYPLLQSVELSNEGTLGSLLKGSFSFTVYPDISSDGFAMGGIEEAFFKPGKEVSIKYGWSVRDGGPNNGQLIGIIYNFDWSVNTDLSISAKCSIVSKATIAIGVSGEQANPDQTDGQTDPLGQPIPDGDMAGIIERDIKNLGGINNKSVTAGGVKFEPSGSVTSKKFNYYIIGMPMSVADADESTLSDADKQKQSDYKAQLATQEKKNAIIKSNEKEYKEIIDEEKRVINSSGPFEYRDGGTLRQNVSKDEYLAYIGKLKTNKENQIKADYSKDFPNDNAEKFLETVRNGVSNSQPSNTTGTTTNVPSTTTAGPYKSPDPPKPINQPVYYISLGDAAEFMNKVLKDSPLGKDLFEIQCSGNTTQHLGSIVSSSPEEVFFPDPEMGVYGDFKPDFSSIPGFKLRTGTSMIDIGNILISTTKIIETYRSFVKENQTSIEYKNMTGFFDQLIKLVNFASGEMYQLMTQLIDPPKGGAGKAILSIEDSNIASEEVKKVTPFGFYATITKPILKTVSISCKPPAASAAAAFTEARRDTKTKTDVRFTADGVVSEFDDAKKQIEDQKNRFMANGAGPTFSTGLKGNYAKYKRSSPSNEGTHWLTKVLYPIDFSVTIDGIDGFKFGDVLKTNLIPARYTKEGMVFVITKIGHTIQNGVWETTLNTKARIDPTKLK
jgi:hypothetical protein